MEISAHAQVRGPLKAIKKSGVAPTFFTYRF
jgi:hypothetical protein